MSHNDPAPLPQDLGKPISTHRFRDDIRRSTSIGASLSLIGTVLAAGYAVWRWRFAYEHFGPALVWRWSAPGILVSLGLSLIALLCLAAMLRQGAVAVRTFRYGMTYQRGRSLDTIRWEQIRLSYTSAFRYGLLGWGRHRHELLLILRDGSKIELSNNLADFSELADSIKEHVYPDLLVEYTQAYAKGRSLPFGPLRITRQGIQKGATLLKWEEYGQVRFASGKLVVLPGGQSQAPSILVPAHRVPNVELCAQLIERLGRSP